MSYLTSVLVRRYLSALLTLNAIISGTYFLNEGSLYMCALALLVSLVLLGLTCYVQLGITRRYARDKVKAREDLINQFRD